MKVLDHSTTASVYRRRTRLHGIAQDLVHRLDLLVFRCVEDDDEGANEAQGASYPSKLAQLFTEENAGEDGADEDGEGA